MTITHKYLIAIRMTDFGITYVACYIGEKTKRDNFTREILNAEFEFLMVLN